MNGSELWIWFVAGMIPYFINQKLVKDGSKTLEVRATFWFATVRLHHGGSPQWTLCVPLIERMQKAFWAAVLKLREDETP